MKKLIISAAILLLVVFKMTAQSYWQTPQTTQTLNRNNDCPVFNAWDVNFNWRYLYSKKGQSFAQDIAFTPDSNIIMLYSNCLTECDREGNVIWTREYFVNDTAFEGYRFTRIGDDYYLIGMVGGYSGRHFGLIKTDTGGNEIWFKELNGINKPSKLSYAILTKVINVENTNLLISINSSNYTVIAKLDSSGNELWNIDNSDLNMNIDNIDFNLFFVNNQYYIFNNNMLIKLSKEGEILSQDTIENRNLSNPKYIEGKFYFSGYDNIEGVQYILRYSNNLELEWQYFELNPQYEIAFTKDIKLLSDKSLLVFYDFYYQEDWGNGMLYYNFNLRHIDENGSCLSTLNLYEYGSQYTQELLITKNEDIIMYGSGHIGYLNEDRVILASLPRNYEVGITERLDKSEIAISPNPGTSKFMIQFAHFFSGQINIYSIDGKLITNLICINQMQAEINLTQALPGIYILEAISNKKERYVNKITTERIKK